MKIYVASSWRNQHQQQVVQWLREAGFQVYDFKNPKPGNNGFSWSEIDNKWQDWSTDSFVKALDHPIAEGGFQLDFEAMMWSDAVVMLMPCGRSAHLEAGWACGSGRITVALILDKGEPELMYKLFNHISSDVVDVIKYLRRYESNEWQDAKYHVSEKVL